MKLIMTVILVFFSILFTTCAGDGSTPEQKDHSIRLSGKVGFPKEGGVILLQKFEGNSPVTVDTIELSDNYTYDTRVEINNPGYYRLDFYGQQSVNVILDKDDVEVNVDGNDQQGFAEVNGSRDHDFLEQVQGRLQGLNSSPDVQKMNQEFSQAQQQGDQEKMTTIRGRYFAMQDSISALIIEDIRALGPSLAAVEVMRTGQVLDRDKYFSFFTEYSDDLEEAYPESEIVKDFVGSVRASAKLAIGSEAPEIALPNPDGEVVKLSSLRGNYVLVDFWAKWCRPCRMENPNIVRMYNKYNDQGFEVFGVSLDRSKEDWLQAIEADGLHWTQVSDLKFWNSEAAQIYNVTAIPFAVLLDPEGKIIGKNLRGAALEQKLQEIYQE